MTPQELFAGLRSLSLPYLTTYHAEAVGDGPDLPWVDNSEVAAASEGWAEARRFHPANLYPATPLERSRFRPGGYALWDFIVRNGRTAMRRSYTPALCGPIADPTTSVRSGYVNRWWFDAVRELWLAGTAIADTLPEEQSAQRRQRLVATGWAFDYRSQRPLLELAHALAHHWRDQQLRAVGFWGRYTFSSRAFLEAAAGLAAARLLNLPVNLHDQELLLPHGLKAVPTTRNGFLAGKPVIQIPYSNTDRLDRYLVCLGLSVTIGNDPIGFLLPGSRPSPEDRYAYEPGLVVAVGWETPAWVYGQDICRYERCSAFDAVPGAFTAAAVDLWPPQSLPLYLEAARPVWPAGPEYRPIDDWLQDKWLRDLISCTPSLPCLQCLLQNRQTEHGLRLPSTEVLRSEIERRKYESTVRRGIRKAYQAKVAADRGYRALAGMRRDRHREQLRSQVAAAQLKDKEMRGCRIRY
jgi:hypothetical protein